MAKNLVIVESPAKARTIEKYLGKGFQVLASYGHVRDLIPKEGAVEPDNGFRMHYQPIEKNHKHVEAIAKATRKADGLYLATDPDREGEAIAWHLLELLRDNGALDGTEVNRVVFHEITQRAINEAMEEPRGISEELVDAQQARRALDYLVGFNLSPLLWKKVRPGLSAGRVQSPALRLIVEREQEIEAFAPQEYWTIEADTVKDEQPFTAKLTHFENEKLEQFTIADEQRATEIHTALDKAAGGYLTVSEVQKKQRRRNPSAPFITSTLQQEASRKLGLSASRTMRIAQQLYEGVELDGGSVGLITYMRTDSVNLAQEALDELRSFVTEQYGAHMAPKTPHTYKTRAKNAQEAHEAIRPTSVYRTPESIKGALTADQYKLYDLIWKRTVACQMIPATLDTVTVDLTAGPGNIFRATGSTIKDPGFMAVYREGKDDTKEGGEDADSKMLPPLEKGEQVALSAIRPEQHFTEPPPRYSEATLVRALEEYGIGRPSTYASIISTLVDREYVILEKRRFRPTDLGQVVNKFLTEYFTQYVDYAFTARMEDQLDAIARGEKDWTPVLEQFWQPFHELVETTESQVRRSDVTTEEIDEACPKCGKPLTVRLGRRGRFIGCSGFPDCDYTRSVDEDRQSAEPEVIEGRSCPKCGSDLLVRRGRYGKFIGCSGYPKCRHVEPLEKPKDTEVPCPKCGKGTMLQRKSRYGKVFYSCSTYPDCDYAVWNEPLNEACPQCHWPMLAIKTTKRRGTEKVCPQKECNYAEPYERPEEKSDEDRGEGGGQEPAAASN